MTVEKTDSEASKFTPRYSSRGYLLWDSIPGAREWCKSHLATMTTLEAIPAIKTKFGIDVTRSAVENMRRRWGCTQTPETNARALDDRNKSYQQFNPQDRDMAAKIKHTKEMASLKAAYTSVVAENEKLQKQLTLIEDLESAKHGRPEWFAAKSSPKSHHRATLNFLITDTHFDEIVNPKEVDHLNAYNRAIAEIRLRKVVEGAIKVARHYMAGVTYDGMVLMLGGDLFSGNIHEELKRTNESTLFSALLHWLGPMHTVIEMFAEEFKRLHVVAVPGNHGRMTHKPIAKQRASDNLDWLFAMLLQREFVRDQRITWNVPLSADAHETIYNTKYLLTHGDQFRGGSGIAGALSPLLLGANRKTRRAASSHKPYDYMVMGHWHQELWLPSKGVLVGGCLKGYDEYAFVSNFDFQLPQQELWLTTPEHGITMHCPIFAMDRKAERW